MKNLDVCSCGSRFSLVTPYKTDRDGYILLDKATDSDVDSRNKKPIAAGEYVLRIYNACNQLISTLCIDEKTHWKNMGTYQCLVDACDEPVLDDCGKEIYNYLPQQWVRTPDGLCLEDAQGQPVLDNENQQVCIIDYVKPKWIRQTDGSVCLLNTDGSPCLDSQNNQVCIPASKYWVLEANGDFCLYNPDGTPCLDATGSGQQVKIPARADKVWRVQPNGDLCLFNEDGNTPCLDDAGNQVCISADKVWRVQPNGDLCLFESDGVTPCLDNTGVQVCIKADIIEEAVCLADEWNLCCPITDGEPIFLDQNGKLRIAPFPQSGISEEGVTDPPCVSLNVNSTSTVTSPWVGFEYTNNSCYSTVMDLQFYTRLYSDGNSSSAGEILVTYRATCYDAAGNVVSTVVRSLSNGWTWHKPSGDPVGRWRWRYDEEVEIPECGGRCLVEYKIDASLQSATSTSNSAGVCMRTVRYQNGGIDL